MSEEECLQHMRAWLDKQRVFTKKDVELVIKDEGEDVMIEGFLSYLIRKTGRETKCENVAEMLHSFA